MSTGDVLSATVRSLRREPVTIILSIFSSALDSSATAPKVTVIADKPDNAIADATKDSFDVNFLICIICSYSL